MSSYPIRQARRVPESRGIPLENEGSYIIRRGQFYLQREDSNIVVENGKLRNWFGAKSTARRFTTRDAAERFILNVLGHAYDLVVVHLLPRGTIARRERRAVKAALDRVLKRYDKECHTMHEAWWFEALGEELS